MQFFDVNLSTAFIHLITQAKTYSLLLCRIDKSLLFSGGLFPPLYPFAKECPSEIFESFRSSEAFKMKRTI